MLNFLENPYNLPNFRINLQFENQRAIVVYIA